MKTILQILIVISIVYLVNSRNQGSQNLLTNKDVVDKNDYSKLKKNVFYIKGLGNVSSSTLYQIRKEIENFYGFTAIVDNSIPIDYNMYIRNTDKILDASTCLKMLDNYSKKVIYVTDKELWSFGDYVNGLAYQNGNTIVVTTAARNLKETVRHEVGHTFGLGHCTELTCVMASKNDKYEIGKFCNKCKTFFKNKFNIQ